MRKNYIKSGDIILIPVDGDRCAVAKIIYLSKRFKDMIFLSTYPLVVNFSEKVIDLPTGSFDELLIYTGNAKIKTEEWKKINNILVTEEEKKMSKRIVAGNIWIEDDYIGAATENDYKTLQQMHVAGAKLVEERMKEYLINIGLL
jgi:hypothetical protein